MDELGTWLRGVLDAEAAIAVAASRGDETTWVQSGYPAHLEDGVDVVVYEEGRPSEEQFAHIALHDPRSVLARVEAERQLLDVHDLWPNDPGECATCHDGTPATMGDLSEPEPYPCETLRLLAYGHRYDADGWRDEWAPDGVAPATTVEEPPWRVADSGGVHVPDDGHIYDVTASLWMAPVRQSSHMGVRLVDDAGNPVALSLSAIPGPVAVHRRGLPPGRYHLEVYGGRTPSPYDEGLTARCIDNDPLPGPSPWP